MPPVRPARRVDAMGLRLPQIALVAKRFICTIDMANDQVG
jgi:hypothetical protein